MLVVEALLGACTHALDGGQAGEQLTEAIEDVRIEANRVLEERLLHRLVPRLEQMPTDQARSVCVCITQRLLYSVS